VDGWRCGGELQEWDEDDKGAKIEDPPGLRLKNMFEGLIEEENFDDSA
jgi:hypothetical protein